MTGYDEMTNGKCDGFAAPDGKDKNNCGDGIDNTVYVGPDAVDAVCLCMKKLGVPITAIKDGNKFDRQVKCFKNGKFVVFP